MIVLDYKMRGLVGFYRICFVSIFIFHNELLRFGLINDIKSLLKLKPDLGGGRISFFDLKLRMRGPQKCKLIHTRDSTVNPGTNMGSMLELVSYKIVASESTGWMMQSTILKVSFA